MAHPELIVASALPPTAEDVSAGYISHPVADFQSYTVFEVSGDAPTYKNAAKFRADQLQSFTAGTIENPVLNNCPDFQEGREERRAMYQQVMSLFSAQQRRRAEGCERTLEDDMIDTNIALRINELGFVETAALLAENSLDDTEKTGLGEVLRTAGQEIYGLPDRDITLTLLAKRLEPLEKLARSDDPELQAIATYVTDHFTMPEDYQATRLPELDEATIKHFEAIIIEECQAEIDEAFSQVDEKDVYTPEDMQKIYQKFIELRGYSKDGWYAAVIEGRTMCSSNLADRVVEIGSKRPASKCDRNSVLKSMIHEIEVHVRRAVEGGRLGSGLAGKGLANYTFFEEPFAGSVQDMYFNEVTQRGEPGICAIAISAGIDGTPRDYRQSFEILWRTAFARRYDSSKPIDEQTTKAQKAANTTLVRIWRGMPTDIPGCIFTKDRSYENSRALAYLQNGGSLLPREDFLRLLSAKYDPYNAKQDAYVRSLTAGLS